MITLTFEVFNSNGNVVMTTDHSSCIPNVYQLKDMAAYGYKFKMDGKTIPYSKIKELADIPPVSSTKTKAKKLF